MGCDIHLFVERREHSDHGDFSWWSCTGEITQRRNYELFGVLSGVRRDFNEPIANSGLPNDLSYPVLLYMRDNHPDLHSHGHISLEELTVEMGLLEMTGEWGDVDAEFALFALDHIRLLGLKIADAWGVEKCDLRFVFAYDN